jgi:hypothetical protein
MSTPTATININNILPNSIYVLGDDLLYSPNKMMPQNVLTSGSAWIASGAAYPAAGPPIN